MKVYKVEFNKYTNGLCNTVWSEKLKKHLKTENKCLIVKESDINYIMNFGEGISSMQYIGKLFEEVVNANNITINNNGISVEELIENIKKELNNRRCFI